MSCHLSGPAMAIASHCKVVGNSDTVVIFCVVRGLSGSWILLDARVSLLAVST